MPRVMTFQNSEIRVNFDDHNPPHFHLRGAGWEIMVEIGSMCILAGNANERETREGLEWARENMDVIRKAWNKYSK